MTKIHSFFITIVFFRPMLELTILGWKYCCRTLKYKWLWWRWSNFGAKLQAIMHRSIPAALLPTLSLNMIAKVSGVSNYFIVIVVSKKWSMFWGLIHVFWNSKLAMSLKGCWQPLQTDDIQHSTAKNTAEIVVTWKPPTEWIKCGLLRNATIYTRSHNLLWNFGFLDWLKYILKLRKRIFKNVENFFEGAPRVG